MTSISREEALASGFNAFLPKPFDLDDLNSTMRDLVRQEEEGISGGEGA